MRRAAAALTLQSTLLVETAPGGAFERRYAALELMLLGALDLARRVGLVVNLHRGTAA